MKYTIWIAILLTSNILAAPIDNHWLETPRQLQPQKSPNYATHWLFIPQYNDYLLIQTQQNATPNYDYTSHTSNFSYVDPTYEHSGKGFHILPAGLFFWKSDYVNISSHPVKYTPPQKAKNARTVRNIPGGQRFVETTNTRNPYESLDKKGVQWNPKGHTSHPSEKDYMRLLYQPPNKPSDNEITLVTINTLAETPYSNFSNVEQMPLDHRAYYFKNGLNNPLLFYEADFICVQEWDGKLAKTIPGYEYIGKQPRSDNFTQLFTGVFYNNNRWKPQKKHTSLELKNKQQIIEQFINTTTQRSVTIASCHIPSTKTSQESINFIKQIYNQAQSFGEPIIMAGDFNYNTYSQKYKQYQPRGGTKDYQMLLNNLNPLNDAAHAYNLTEIPTAYDKNFTRMDYIWHSPSLQINDYTMFPTDENNNLNHLIKHSKANLPAYTYHFSDHAAIRSSFTYTDTSTAKIDEYLKQLEQHINYLYTAL